MHGNPGVAGSWKGRLSVIGSLHPSSEMTQYAVREAEIGLLPLLPCGESHFVLDDARKQRIEGYDAALAQVSLVLKSGHLPRTCDRFAKELVSVLNTNRWLMSKTWTERPSRYSDMLEAAWDRTMLCRDAWEEVAVNGIPKLGTVRFADWVGFKDAISAHVKTRADCVFLLRNQDPEIRDMGLKLSVQFNGQNNAAR